MAYNISYQLGAPPAAFSQLAALKNLRASGFIPRTIYDIGAFQGQWSREAGRVFKAAEIIQFEANSDNAPNLRQNGRRFFIVALAAQDAAQRAFFVSKRIIATGASLYRERTRFYAEEEFATRMVKTTRLDTLVAEQKLNYPDLMKLDVQGAELEVLAGAQNAIARCSALILETSLLNYNKDAPLIADVMKAINDLGLKCVDICEVHRLGPGLLLQVDLLFVRQDIHKEYCRLAGLT